MVTLLLWPRSVEAVVVGANWKSIVTVERYQIIREDGWDAPSDAVSISNEGRRVHHHDRVQVGTHKVQYSESYVCGQTCTTSPRTCRSNGNGVASCSGGNRTCRDKHCSRPAYRTEPTYENQPRYRDWYSWRVWRWKFDRTIERSGSDFQPKLPENPNLIAESINGEKERSTVSWDYSVVFQDNDQEKFNYKPASESAFLSFHVGDSHTLKVSGLGVSIKR